MYPGQLRAELDVLTRELDKAQRMIDHGRKTILGLLPPVKSYLNHRQVLLDSQRIRVEAAKEYLDSTK